MSGVVDEWLNPCPTPINIEVLKGPTPANKVNAVLPVLTKDAKTLISLRRAGETF